MSSVTSQRQRVTPGVTPNSATRRKVWPQRALLLIFSNMHEFEARLGMGTFVLWHRAMLSDCSVLWGKKQRWLTVLNTLSILWVCEMQMKSNVAYLSSTFYVFVIMPTVFICMPTVIIILRCRLWNKYELMPQLFMSAIIKESTGNAGHNQRCLNQSSAPSNSAPTL